MPGAISTNTRTGHLAEDLGCLIMRSIAAVAPIEPADDFGIDAIATLLEPDPNTHLRQLATSSFAIQFKAKSVREILYTQQHEAKWLTDIRVPFFIGSVDYDKATLDLYSINNLTSIPGYNHFQSISLHLDEVETGTNVMLGTPPMPIKILDPKEELKIFLGKPAMRLSLAALQRDSFLQNAVNCLRTWLTFETENIKYRKIGWTCALDWQTNKIPTLAQRMNSYRSDKVPDLYEEEKTHVKMVFCAMYTDCDDKKVQSAIEVINQYLGKTGVTLFEPEAFDKMRKQKKDLNRRLTAEKRAGVKNDDQENHLMIVPICRKRTQESH